MFNIRPSKFASLFIAWCALQLRHGRLISGLLGLMFALSHGGAIAANDAAFVSQVVPANMTVGETYTMSVTMKNTGSGTSWTAASGYSLVMQNSAGWSITTLPVSAATGLNVSRVFSTTVMTPPSTPGSYTVQWCMVQSGVPFGACSTPVAVQVSARTPDATFSSQSMTSTLAVATRAITVTMRNTGNTTWKAGQVFMGIQNPRDNTVWGINRLKLSSNVAPNGLGSFTGTITSPAPGYYDMQWQVVGESGNYFGDPSTALNVAVAGDPPTLVIESPDPDGYLAGSTGTNLTVPIKVVATPTGVATIKTTQMLFYNPNTSSYDAWITENGPVIDREYRFQAISRALLFRTTDSFGKITQVPFTLKVKNDGATLVSNSLPTTLVPGLNYDISLVMKNSGTTTWNSQMVSLTPSTEAQVGIWGDLTAVLDRTVAPGESATFNLRLTAPPSEGSYSFSMQLRENNRGLFGPVMIRAVTVARPLPTVVMNAPVSGATVEVATGSTGKVRVQGSASPGVSATISKLEVLDGTAVVALVDGPAINQDVELAVGTHSLKLRATDNFGETASTAVATVTVKGNNAAFVSQVVPATMQVGKTYTPTITMRNSGNKPWTAAAGYALGAQNPTNNTVWRANRVPPSTTVGVNGQLTFSVPVTAPTKPGTYNFQWQMLQEGVEWFGPMTNNVEVVVNPLAPTVGALSMPVASEKFIAVATKGQVRVKGTVPASEGAAISKLEVLDGATVIATADGGSIDAVVPLAVGAHTLKMRATDNFGQVVTATATTAITVLSNSASAVSRTAATPMVGGNEYQVTVVMRNAGTATWTPEDGYALGPVPDDRAWVKAYQPVQAAIAPGANATFTFNVVAPEDPAVYPFQWQMLRQYKDGTDTEWFGTKSTVLNITVTGVPPTVNLTGPASGSSYQALNGTAAVPVAGTAKPTGTASITTFEVLDGSKVAYTGSGNTLNTVLALAPGAHTLQLRATDSRKAVTLSQTTTVTVSQNNATLVSQSVPTAMYAGDRYPVTLTFKNTGDTTWQPYAAQTQRGVALAEHPLGNMVWSQNGRMQLTKAVAPGESYTFSMEVVAPATPKTYPFQWRLSDESREVFGALSTLVNVVVTAPPIPEVLLSASPVNQRVAPGQNAAVTLVGSASVKNSALSKLEVFADTGSGYDATPIKTISGNAAQLALNEAVSLAHGSYRLKLRATAEGGHYGESKPVLINITDSPLLGQVMGVRSSGAQQLQLVGWACRDSSPEALSFKVFVNAPPALGGVEVASGAANLGSETNAESVAAQCHTPGIAHHFVVDLAGLQAQYPGAPLYVSASSTQGQSIVLPCEDHSCRIPQGMRIGLTSPNANNLDRFRLPMPAFVRAVVSGTSGTPDEVSFNINGQWLPAADEGSGGAYSASKADLPASVAPYAVYAKVRQGDTTLITETRLFYVDSAIEPGEISPRSGTTVSLGRVVELSTIVNAAVEPGQSVKFFINPKAAAGTQLRQGGASRSLKSAAISTNSSIVAGLVGDAIYDGSRWRYNWLPDNVGTFDVMAKLIDRSGLVLMQTPVAVLTVGKNNTPDEVDLVPVAKPEIVQTVVGAANAGSLPGDMIVGQTGEASYTIPVEVPPGTAGLQPELLLQYSSSAPNGVLGLGWHLAGISYIERCAKSIAQDGVYGRISMNNGDRLCLDGQRLVRVDGGNSDDDYWATAAIYRTETDIFARVSRQANGGFKVEWRDGRISLFGLGANSTLPSQGNGAPVVKWGLARTEDRHGNYLTVEYTACAARGDCHPLAVRYGGNLQGEADHPADNAVIFEYDDVRPDAQKSYIGGVQVDMAKRLRYIRTYIDTDIGVGGTMVREYEVRYAQSATSGRSMVSSIQLQAVNPVDGTLEVLPPTNFEWGQGGSISLKAVNGSAFSLPYFGGRDPTILLGDVDGSGRSSVVALEAVACGLSGEPPCYDPTIKPHLTGRVKIRGPDGTESTTSIDLAAMGINTTIFAGADNTYLADLNGDGFDDLVVLHTGDKKWGYCVNNATGTPATFSCMAGGNGLPKPVHLRGDRVAHLIGRVDQSGNAEDCTLSGGAMVCTTLRFSGMPSLLANEPNLRDPDAFYLSSIALSRQPVSDFLAVWSSFADAANPADPYAVDINNKPMDRIGGATTCFNEAGGMRCQTLQQSRSVGKVWTSVGSMEQYADFNGDGLTDFILSYRNAGDQSGRQMCLSKENGIDCLLDRSLETVAPFYYNLAVDATSGAKIGDFMGDGVTRMIFHTPPTKVGETYSRTNICRYGLNGFTCDAIPFTELVWPGYQVGYPDGSGLPAILSDTGTKIDNRPAYQYTSFAMPAATDRIVKVTNGIGHVSEIDYARGDDGAVYTHRPIVDGRLLTPAYPSSFAVPGTMVKQLRRTSGGSGWLTKNYQYAGALEDVAGRGSLGMAIVKESDPDTMIDKTVYYSQSYPTAGMPLREIVQSVRGGAVIDLSDTSKSYTLVSSAPTAPQVRWVLPSSSISSRRDLSGTTLGTEEVVVENYDIYGNVLQKRTTTSGPGGAFTTTLLASITPDEDKWLLGLPSSVSETRGGPEGDVIKRTTDFTYKNGLLDTETVEAGTALSVKLTHTRTSQGLEQVRTQVWKDPDGKDQRRDVVTKTFDPVKGRFAEKQTNAAGHDDRFTYYPQTGRTKTWTDANLLRTEYTSDGFGRLKAIASADGNVVLTHLKQCAGLCPAGATMIRVSEFLHGENYISSPKLEFLSATGQPIRISTWGAKGEIVVDYVYDALGRLETVYQPRLSNEPAYIREGYAYDDLGRVNLVRYRDEYNVEQTKKTYYDGLATTFQNEDSFYTRETRDVLNHVVEVEDAEHKRTSMTYDAFGNLLTSKDPNGNVVKIAYDKLGRRTDLRDPDLGWIHSDVDAIGRLYRNVSPEDRLTQGGTLFEYDNLDRMTRRVERDLESRWTFDVALPATASAKGKLISASTWNKALQAPDYEEMYEYDQFGAQKNVRRKGKSGIHTTEYQYDGWRRLFSEAAVPSIGKAKFLEYRYDDTGRLVSARRDGATLWTIASVDPAGRTVALALGNGLTEKRAFNIYSGRLEELALLNGESSLLQQTYKYNQRGLVWQRSAFWSNQSGFIEDFTYDGLNRLATSTIGERVLSYGYDNAGNLKRKGDLSAATEISYFEQALGEGSLPHAVKTIPGSSEVFAYDKNGNLKSGAGRAIAWMSFNMPASLAKNGYTSTFVYGPEHQRIRQDRTGGQTSLSTEYFGTQRIDSKNNQVAETRTYWPLGNGFDVDTESGLASTFWTHVDSLGSVLAISDANGNIKEALAYDPWGKRRELNGIPSRASTATPDTIDGVLDDIGFTGEEMLDSLDLVHLNGRVYDPSLGRFISADPYVTNPYDGQNLNRYSYVYNSPLNYTDPSGYSAAMPTIPVPGQLPGFPGAGGFGGGGGAVGGGYPNSTANNKPPIPPSVTVRGKSISTNGAGVIRALMMLVPPQAQVFLTLMAIPTNLFQEQDSDFAKFYAKQKAANALSNKAPKLAAASSDAKDTNSAPPVPGDLVGDQSDPRAGTSNSGKRHTSGPLTPENGGTGDAEKDFDKLTGGTGKPFPGTDGRSKIPGAQVGDNGVWIRPGTKSPGDGPRIEIPGNGNKLPETLHY